MIQKTLIYCFYLLFAVTPLLWAPWNFELFEYNKMMFVYFLTVIITTFWLIKMIRAKKLLIKKTPLDIPILLFLLANILSTIFSIDKHVSLWGYYSRLNGGLLSIISYTILYFALVANFEKEKIINFLKAAIWGGLLVSLWAIPEHFGISPSCIILTGQANASCWVQDVEARVFATLGQPNWLAAYLLMLIFPTFYFLLTAPSRFAAIRYTLYAILLYLAFTFTYSRGAALGLVAGLAIFIIISNLISNPRGWIFRSLIPVLVSFLIINILFGSALTDFKLISKFAAPARPAIELTQAPAKSSGTQLETGGTESGQIRLIVWQGAWEIFKAYPILGSGVETFAYSYYKFRPAEHNLTSEWDYLYNKAHNEFLNYLATTGIIGFSAYCIIIITFIIIILRKPKTRNLLSLSLSTAFIANLVQSFFSFSVVVTNLFFFLFPALAFIAADYTKPLSLPKNIISHFSFISLIYRRVFYLKFAQIVLLLLAALLIFILFRNYLADISFAEGSKYEDTNPGKAYNNLTSAVSLNSNEPFYQSELAFAAASAAVSLSSTDATLSAKLKNQAILETSQVLQNYPNNVSYFRTAIRTYYLLSTLDSSLVEKTLQTFDAGLSLAPTDAKLYYNKAVVELTAGNKQAALRALQKAIKLKPNYIEAKEALKKLEDSK